MTSSKNFVPSIIIDYSNDAIEIIGQGLEESAT